ncbi:MAG: AI-2E family transporter [Candidatus Pacearchaeota archaeon]|nr:MAG: AI-2E family transporter [Candidatus Pacearchaeota archaeon]
MLNEPLLKNIISVLLFFFLIVLSFFILKPILFSIIFALVLAFIFNPVYDFIYLRIKSRNIAAFLIVLILLVVIILPIWFFLPTLLRQSYLAFQSINQIDFVEILQTILPKTETMKELSNNIGPVLNNFVSSTISSFSKSLTKLILDFPVIGLQIFVVFFTLFYVLRDKDQIILYVKEILPFQKEIKERLFKYTQEVTSSILYGQIIVGIIQGLIAGIGFFIFKVNNAFFLTIIAIILGVLPIIGTAIVWIPVVIFLFVAGNPISGWGVFVFGIISSTIDNILRPIIVSKKTKLSPLILLISMIGGVFVFGILGFIIGPLVISYLIVLLEAYKGKPGTLSIFTDSQGK